MSSSDPIHVLYELSLEDGSNHRFDVALDPHSLALRLEPVETPPFWTQLEFKQCSNCPLDPAQTPVCPLAASLVDMVQLCKDLASFEEVDVKVSTPERTIIATTTVQRAIASLMGLRIATSGCPHTTLFRPMARFHLPFATEEETIYRATSMYVLSQYFAQKRGLTPDHAMNGLLETYEAMHVVNMHIAKRLWEVVSKDASVNALILLDLFSKALPDTIEDSLDEISYLYTAYLDTLS